VANSEVEPILFQQIAKSAPCSPHRQWISNTNVAQIMHRCAGGLEFVGQAPSETEGKVRLQLRTQIVVPGHGNENCFQTAEKISATDV
jgi:hypothetical protein